MKQRYRYLGCHNGRMVWQTVNTIPGDSRVEQISCEWSWFWRKPLSHA